MRTRKFDISRFYSPLAGFRVRFYGLETTLEKHILDKLLRRVTVPNKQIVLENFHNHKERMNFYGLRLVDRTGKAFNSEGYNVIMEIMNKDLDRPALAYLVFKDMKQAGVKPDCKTYSILMCSFKKGKFWRECVQFFDEMNQSGIIPNAVAYNTLIDCLSKAGKRDLALKYYEMMTSRGVAPDAFTYSSLIMSCLLDKNGDLALELFDKAREAGFFGNNFVCTAVINCLRRLDRFDDVMNLFEELKSSKKTVGPSVYKVLLRTTAIHLESEKMLDLMKEMQSQNISVSKPFFDSVLDMMVEKSRSWKHILYVMAQSEKLGLVQERISWRPLLASMGLKRKLDRIEGMTVVDGLEVLFGIAVHTNHKLGTLRVMMSVSKVPTELVTDLTKAFMKSREISLAWQLIRSICPFDDRKSMLILALECVSKDMDATMELTHMAREKKWVPTLLLLSKGLKSVKESKEFGRIGEVFGYLDHRQLQEKDYLTDLFSLLKELREEKKSEEYILVVTRLKSAQLNVKLIKDEISFFVHSTKEGATSFVNALETCPEHVREFLCSLRIISKQLEQINFQKLKNSKSL